jgi:hypothetical protein
MIPPDSNWVYKVSGTIIVSLWLALLLFRAFPDPQGTDFYPLWIGAKAVVNGENPYSQATTSFLKTHWSVAPLLHVSDAIGYPLPVLMVIAPLTMLPLDIAVYVWFALLLGSVVVFILAFDWKGPLSWVIPLLSFPLIHALAIKNTAVLWLGLIGLLRLSINKALIATGGFCIALLPGKPQTGMVIAIAVAVWALRNNRAILLSAFLWTLVLWGGSLLLQPQWPFHWSEAVRTYREQVVLTWLLPQALVLPLFSKSLSWFAIAAATQVIAFPVNDIYSTLPLLVGWTEIGGSLALVGIGCSLLAVLLFQNPHHTFVIWLTMLLPYCACALVHRFATLKKCHDES